MQPKFIFITGGVCSSLGKGLTAAALGHLLELQGHKIGMLKLDPYLNVDPGTMSPFQHGEVYVTDDGAETDLDLGHYHRFTNAYLSKASNATSGQIYHSVIKRERRGDYLGKTVQVVPHVTDEIKKRIFDCIKDQPDLKVLLVEIGGTIGDIESLPFLEAIRQFTYENRDICLNVHLTYVPYLKAAGEVKTKPSQHSVQVLREIGIMPDILICRSEDKLPQDVKEKLSLFCNVPLNAVIEEPDVQHSIYEVPLQLKAQGVDNLICDLLNLPSVSDIDLSAWKKIVDATKNPIGEVTIGMVGKYIQHQDAYKSVNEALSHAALSLGYKLKIKSFEADKLSTDYAQLSQELSGLDGILVPGGFGERGWEGKILTAKYCRENGVPYFGICLGMQVMAVEFARHVLGLKDASSTEIDPATTNPIVSLLTEQKGVKDLGGTMRLGSYRCTLSEGSKAYQAYGKAFVDERHRHRYEFNNHYRADMEAAGFKISGTLPENNLCEISEISDHPWMVAVQFHPEFKSKPTAAHPLFKDFIQAAIRQGGHE